MALTVATVDAAIEALLTGGQSYSIAGRSFTRANLSELRKLRTELLAQENRATRGISSVADFSRSTGSGDDGEWGGGT